MIKLILFFISFLLYACHPNSVEENNTAMEMKLYNEWLYSFKIQDLKENGVTITRPPGVEQLIIRLTIPTDGGASFKTHCVYYQVPYKKIEGLLKIQELKMEVSCPEISSGESWAIIDKISDMTVTLEDFKLHLDFMRNHKKLNWLFLLPNIDNGLVHEKYQAVKEKKLYSGMSILRISEESFDNLNNKYLGKLGDRVSRGSAIRCQQVDKNCQTVGDDRCDDCRYGWYQVVDYNCPQGGSKFCGQNHCGEKNEPACPRGTKVVGGEDAGICQSDLTAVMNADHILICQ